MSEKETKAISTPSRISNRDDVWRTIRDWAKPCGRTGEPEDDEDEEGSSDNGRMIGSQIKDNVTEQRLLESRLLDLSKERYKFIVQVAWQRKAFMDKQKRKTSVMRDLLRNVDTAEASAGAAVQTGKNYRRGLAEKLDNYRELVKKTYSEQRQQELLRRDPDPEEMKPIIPGTVTDPIYKTEPINFSARSRRRETSTRGSNRNGRELDSGAAGKGRKGPQNLTMFPAIQPPESSRQHSVPPNFMRRGISRMSGTSRLPDAVSRPGAASTTGMPRPKVSMSADNLPRYLKFRSVYDGRFKRLERSLSASYDGKTEPNIESILNGLPSRSMSVAL